MISGLVLNTSVKVSYVSASTIEHQRSNSDISSHVPESAQFWFVFLTHFSSIPQNGIDIACCHNTMDGFNG